MEQAQKRPNPEALPAMIGDLGYAVHGLAERLKAAAHPEYREQAEAFRRETAARGTPLPTTWEELEEASVLGTDILDRLTAYHETGDPAALDQVSRDRRDYVDADVPAAAAPPGGLAAAAADLEAEGCTVEVADLGAAEPRGRWRVTVTHPRWSRGAGGGP
jgi:hypothetical protein